MKYSLKVPVDQFAEFYGIVQKFSGQFVQAIEDSFGIATCHVQVESPDFLPAVQAIGIKELGPTFWQTITQFFRKEK